MRRSLAPELSLRSLHAFVRLLVGLEKTSCAKLETYALQELLVAVLPTRPAHPHLARITLILKNGCVVAPNTPAPAARMTIAKSDKNARKETLTPTTQTVPTPIAQSLMLQPPPYAIAPKAQALVARIVNPEKHVSKGHLVRQPSAPPLHPAAIRMESPTLLSVPAPRQAAQTLEQVPSASRTKSAQKQAAAPMQSVTTKMIAERKTELRTMLPATAKMAQEKVSTAPQGRAAPLTQTATAPASHAPT